MRRPRRRRRRRATLVAPDPVHWAAAAARLGHCGGGPPRGGGRGLCAPPADRAPAAGAWFRDHLPADGGGGGGGGGGPSGRRRPPRRPPSASLLLTSIAAATARGVDARLEGGNENGNGNGNGGGAPTAAAATAAAAGVPVRLFGCWRTLAAAAAAAAAAVPPAAVSPPPSSAERLAASAASRPPASLCLPFRNQAWRWLQPFRRSRCHARGGSHPHLRARVGVHPRPWCLPPPAAGGGRSLSLRGRPSPPKPSACTPTAMRRFARRRRPTFLEAGRGGRVRVAAFWDNFWGHHCVIFAMRLAADAKISLPLSPVSGPAVKTAHAAAAIFHHVCSLLIPTARTSHRRCPRGRRCRILCYLSFPLTLPLPTAPGHLL